MQKNNIVKAVNKNVRSGARKANLLLNFIKGKKADIAIRDLEFTRKKVAEDIKKTVRSAVANAENNYQYDIDNLYVKEAYVGKSIIMKRFRPRAKGRAAAIKKPFSRITIILEEKQNQKKEGIKK
tara:strand:+ start:53 stop:427 length:375 start_codon:yes stop_codon:yes gene_type:complete